MKLLMQEVHAEHVSSFYEGNLCKYTIVKTTI